MHSFLEVVITIDKQIKFMIFGLQPQDNEF